VRPLLVAGARITPTTAAAGAPLPAGQWDVRVSVAVAGFASGVRLKQEDGEPLIVTAVPPARVVLGDRAPDPPPLRRRLATRAPRTADALRRTRAAGAAAVRS
jgi:hypothetical protein